MEVVIRNRSTCGLRWRLGLLLLRARHGRFRHGHHRRHGRATRVRRGHEARRHGDHPRGARDLAAGHLRIEDGRRDGRVRGQQHRQRDRQQLGECLFGPWLAVDDLRHLLGVRCDMLKRGLVVGDLPYHRARLRHRHFRGEGWQLGRQRDDLLPLRCDLHRHLGCPALLHRWRARGPAGTQVGHGSVLRDLVGRVHRCFHSIQRRVSQPSLRSKR
mmetsp:Transcript_118787/g.296192  ORF Transcript_118787/g.296192 Transcript_118787/m.296192 type:complete len:215 (-) Transcript_118787:290-934(-)